MDPKTENLTQPEPQVPEIKEGFNKTPLLVAVLVILTGILLIVSFTSRNGGQIPFISQEKEVVGPTLSLSEQRVASVSGSAEVDVLVDTAKEIVNGVQLELTYEAAELEISDIAPGPFIPEAQVLIKKIDVEKGVVEFAVASKLGDEGIKGKGVVATVTFVKETEGESELSFGPGSLITKAGSEESVLYQTNSGALKSTLSSSQ